MQHLLGQSRSSQTYLAVDTLSQIACVIKQVEASDTSSVMLQKLKDLQHPQLPLCLDIFEAQEYFYYVQEYIAGESMAARLKRLGCFSLAEIWQMLEQTLSVLKHLHCQEILHGDVRPENLIARTGLNDPVLVDLAIVATGSPEYAAPEQVQGKPVFASDLYSLGLTGLNLLTGLRPIEFWNANDPQHWRDYLPPQPFNSDRERLVQFLERLLVADPAQRFTAVDAIAALELIRGRKQRMTVASLPIHCAKTLNGCHGLGGVNAVAMRQDLLASGSDDKSIRLWQLPIGAACGELSGHQGAVKAMAFHPHNPILASGSQDGSIKLWDCETRQMLQTLTDHSSAVNAVTFSPDGQILASGSSDKTIRFWQAGECIATLSGHRLAVNAVAFSPDGQQIASAGADSLVRLWNIAGECLQIFSGHTQAVRAVAFSPDGMLASGGKGAIRVWDLATGDYRLLSGHSWPVAGLLFSPDGEYLISASWDKTIKIWRVQTGEEVALLSGHTDSVNGIALADGLIASASKDKTVKLWEYPS